MDLWLRYIGHMECTLMLGVQSVVGVIIIFTRNNHWPSKACPWPCLFDAQPCISRQRSFYLRQSQILEGMLLECRSLKHLPE